MSLLGEFAAYMRRRSLAPATIRRRLALLAEFDQQHGLLHATRHDVETFMDARAHLTDRSRYSILSHLSRFYDWAEREELVSSNPVRQVDRPKLPSTLPRPIADGDLRMALETADRTMRAWLTLAAFAGFRCAEIAGLQADSVQPEPMLLRAFGKGRKERLVPMHPQVLSALVEYGLPSRGYVFRRPSGMRYLPAHISREAAVFLDGLAIPATLHQCRHWFGTRVLDECGDLRVVQELLGHASISTTQIYTAFNQVRAKDAVGALSLRSSV